MAKWISGAVGRGSFNTSAKDVLTIQYLLNCVPAGSGGPQPELVMDGICGPKTIGAIEGFQKAHLGRADGRVDPGGITHLTLQGYDPAPNQPLGHGGGKSGGGKSGGKSGGKHPHGKMPYPDPFGKLGGKQAPGSPFGGKTGPGGKFGGKTGPGGKSGGFGFKW